MNRSRTPTPVQITIPCHGKRRCNDIVSVVVTYNRKDLLLRCLKLLQNQSRETDILIVDNASTDGTEQELKSACLLDAKNIHYINLSENTGGAGGFHYGLKYAFKKGWEWFWLMDDDAEPHYNALEKLAFHAVNKDNIYGSAAVNMWKGRVSLCFGVKRYNQNNKTEFLDEYDLLNSSDRVAWLPFLGFFIHRSIISKIGFPDRDFFIRNDDLEYGERARKHGIKIHLIKESVIEHPLQPTIKFVLFGRPFYHRSMPPWKMYYEVRNKIIIAKRHYTFFSGIKSFAGVSFQILLSILTEKDKKAYLKSYFYGILDGLKTS